MSNKPHNQKKNKGIRRVWNCTENKQTMLDNFVSTQLDSRMFIL